MNYKRAIILGILIYIATFIIGAGLFFLGFDNPSDLLTNIIGLAVLIILTAIGSLYYFKDKKAKKTAKEGFFLGIIFLAVGFVLDFLTIIPLIFRGINLLQVLSSIYVSYYFVIGAVFVICLPVVIAEYLRDKKR